MIDLTTAPYAGWEYPAFWTAALVAVFLLGDGRATLRSSLLRCRSRMSRQ
jgi:hypothetical protein